MGALNRRDYVQVLSFLECLYSFQDKDAFARWLVREIPRLVGCHHGTWNEIVVGQPRSVVVEYPVLGDVEQRTANFAAHLLEHPGLVNYLATGDPGPSVVSDHLNTDALHRTNLYQDLYRDLGYEDQVGIMLASPAPRMSGLALARDRRGFTDRDREVMRRIRPHLALATGNMETLARARAQLEEDGDPASVYLLETDGGGRVIRGLDRAQAAFRTFFPKEGRTGVRDLPPDLARWLRNDRYAPFARVRGERRLVARFFATGQRQGMAGRILLQDQTRPSTARGLESRGLTAREVEVLLELEKGFTNEGMAVNLFISPLTVKKHLENIYAKLGVRNRASALYWLRQQARD